ncbi:MAG: polysaccharide deacetylase family protein [Clostridia bacterium]|nr:polysaccharide deacetylase family protein [Clostridia bacterium]
MIKKIIFFAVCFMAIAGLIASEYLSGAYTVYTAGKVSSRKLPIYRVGRDDGLISISFDCAWGAEYTDKILDALDFYGIKCTFFAVQFWAERYPEYLKKISEKGHEIGTHSATHPKMSELSESAIIEELKTSSEAITAVTGKAVELFRAPFGDYDDLLIETASGLGLYTIQWDVDSLDWKDLSAEQIATRVISRVKSGSIILCHNNGLHTAESLPLIFAALIEKGYVFAPIGSLIYRENYEINVDGEQVSKSNN